MCRKHEKRWLRGGVAALIITSISLPFSGKGIAAEDAATPTVATSGDASMSPARADKDIVSVKLPVIAEEKASPLDFVLDPCGLLYDTDAVRYGGGSVEEGATLLFHNKEGEFDLSSCSDPIEVANRGGDPIIVTISASICDLGELQIMESGDFSESEGPGIYLAITDDQGNEQPIPTDGELLIRQEIDEDTYSFGLTGACGPAIDWQDVDPSIRPKVKVTWHVESAETEEEEDPEGWGEQVESQETSAPEAGTAPADNGEDDGQRAEDVDGQTEAPLHPDGMTEGTPGQEGADGTTGTVDPNGTENSTSDQNRGDGVAGPPMDPDGAEDGVSDQNGMDGSSGDQADSDGASGLDGSGGSGGEQTGLGETGGSISDPDGSDRSDPVTGDAAPSGGTEDDGGWL